MKFELFLQNLENRITEKHLLHHDFYKAWSKGELSIECLQEYAKEYYHHVKAFPTYLSALHSHIEEEETRKALLHNLVEEEGGAPNHPELWREFALHLGVTSQQLDTHRPCQKIRDLIETFRSICRNKSVCEGLSALYAYESQVPAICVSKIEGLKQHYQMKDQKCWRYFTVHIEADKEHARIERELLAKHVNSENFHSSLEASEEVLEALWGFLSHLTHRFQIKCA